MPSFFTKAFMTSGFDSRGSQRLLLVPMMELLILDHRKLRMNSICCVSAKALERSGASVVSCLRHQRICPLLAAVLYGWAAHVPVLPCVTNVLRGVVVMYSTVLLCSIVLYRTASYWLLESAGSTARLPGQSALPK